MKKMMTEEERRIQKNKARRKNRPDRGKKRRDRDPQFLEKIKNRSASRHMLRAWKREMNKNWEIHHFNGDEDPMNFAYLPKDEHRRLHAIYGDNKALSEEILINKVKTPCIIFHNGKFEAMINGQVGFEQEA